MILFWNFLLHIIFIQLNVHYVITSWPSSNSSNIQLLGLFPDVDNTSETNDVSIHSRAMFKAAIHLSQLANTTIDGQSIEAESAQTNGDVIDALSVTCQALLKTNIVGIIGPARSNEAPLLAAFGHRLGIPVVSYAATDPDLSNRNLYPAFYRTVPSDNTAALAIVKLFLRFNWTSCIMIYQNDAFGLSGSKIINEAFLNHGLIIRDMLLFDINTRCTREDLKISLENSVTRIVLLWIESTYTYDIIRQALNFDVIGPKFIWILTSSISLDRFNKTSHSKLIGMLTVEPVIGCIVNATSNLTLLNSAYKAWQEYEPETFPKNFQVNYYALFTFDATWLLIQSLQKFCSQNLNTTSCYSFIQSSSCFNRQLINSDLLFNIINQIEFLGVSGLMKFNNYTTDRINGSYFYSQNIQAYSNGLKFVPILDYSSDTNDWKVHINANSIVWSGNLQSQPTDRAKLSGVKLRIAVIEVHPFTIVSDTIDDNGQKQRNFTGYVPDLIELLRERIGFIPDIRLALINQTYARTVQLVVDGFYDIVIGDVTITSQRRELVGFSNSIFDNSLHIIMRKTTYNNIDLLSFLRPFSTSLWLLLLAACLIAGILICLIERDDNHALENRSLFSQFNMSLMYSFGNILGFGTDFHVSTGPGRLLTVGLYILGLVLVASYTANLTSNLTLSKSKGIISNIDDIKNGKIKLNRIGIRIGTASEEYFKREISHGLESYYKLNSKQHTYDALLDGSIDVSFIDIGVGEYITNNVYCNLTLIGDGFDTGAFGIVTPKDWLYAQELDVQILALRELGEIEKIRRKWFAIKACQESSDIPIAMGIESMSGLFLVFAIICILSLVLFLWIKREKMKNYLIKSTDRKKFSSKRKNSMKTPYYPPNSDLLHF